MTANRLDQNMELFVSVDCNGTEPLLVDKVKLLCQKVDQIHLLVKELKEMISAVRNDQRQQDKLHFYSVGLEGD